MTLVLTVFLEENRGFEISGIGFLAFLKVNFSNRALIGIVTNDGKGAFIGYTIAGHKKHAQNQGSPSCFMMVFL